jgi:uncharacterized protein (TIGR00297 family)
VTLDYIRLSLAILANCGLAFVALHKGLVTWSGGITGFFLGFSIYLAWGFWGWLVLGSFFLSSSFFGKLRSRNKMIAEQKSHKGGKRDGLQAFSNAGPGAISALLYLLFGGSWFLAGFLISMSCATADTWSSELGVHSKRDPIDLKTFRIVEPGTSGAVSLLGIGAAFCGAWIIALVGLPVVVVYQYDLLSMIVLTGILGFVGSLVDSLLGAFLQVQYVDDQGFITEKSVTRGIKNKPIRGIHWLNNDIVNLISNSTVTGLAIGITLWSSQGYLYL